MRTHTQERPYACPFAGCEKRFIQRSALSVHINVHTGERPFVCSECLKAFADTSSLARHRRTHSGRRPYKCQVLGCEKEFCRRTTLTKHMQRVHPEEDHPMTPSSVLTFPHMPPMPPMTAIKNVPGPPTSAPVSAPSMVPMLSFLPPPTTPVSDKPGTTLPPAMNTESCLPSSVQVHHRMSVQVPTPAVPLTSSPSVGGSSMTASPYCWTSPLTSTFPHTPMSAPLYFPFQTASSSLPLDEKQAPPRYPCLEYS